MCQLLVTANIIPSSPILVTLMMEVLRSSEMLVLTRATQHIIPESGILQSSPCFNNYGTSCFQIRWGTLVEKGPLHGTGLTHYPQAYLASDFNSFVSLNYSLSRPVVKGQ
jgi:hypothetical protein